jgi:hypothetical protein
VDSNPGVPSTQPSTGRRKRRAIVVVAALALTLTAFAGTHTISAGALPPTCDDGSPPPCPPPDTDPTTTPTTTNPPPVSWTARVNVLDQSGIFGFNRTVTGSWGRSGSPSYSTPSGNVVWSDPSRLEGTVGLTSTYLPPGNVVGFRLVESQSSGRLCRSNPVGAVPGSGRSVHVLVAPPVVKSQTDLNNIAQGFTGVSNEGGAQLTISQASLSATNTGLQLDVAGSLYADLPWPFSSINTGFTYSVLLHVQPSRSIDDVHQVMTVSADVGNLHIDPKNVTTSIITDLAGDIEPDFRSAVTDKVQTAINDNVAAQPQSIWFRSLGYAVSVRTVVTSATSGFVVFPSVCKVD